MPDHINQCPTPPRYSAQVELPVHQPKSEVVYVEEQEDDGLPPLAHDHEDEVIGGNEPYSPEGSRLSNRAHAAHSLTQYRLASDILVNRGLISADPKSAKQLLLGIGLHVPLAVILATFPGHERGHNKGLFGDVGGYGSLELGAASAGTANGMGITLLMAEASMLDLQNGGEPKLYDKLFYTVTKLDPATQYVFYLLKGSGLQSSASGFALGESGHSGGGDIGFLTDSIHRYRLGIDTDEGRFSELGEDYQLTDADRGYPKWIVPTVALGHMFFDPTFWYSVVGVAKGDGSPPPDYIPQVHGFFSPYGPQFHVLERIPLQRGCGEQVVSHLEAGVGATLNIVNSDGSYNEFFNQERFSYNWRIGVKHLDLSFVTSHLSRWYLSLEHYGALVKSEKDEDVRLLADIKTNIYWQPKDGVQLMLGYTYRISGSPTRIGDYVMPQGVGFLGPDRQLSGGSYMETGLKLSF